MVWCPGRRAGGGLVAEVDGPLVHECGEFVQVAVDLRVTAAGRALGVGGRAGSVAAGEFADPRVQDLGDVLRPPPAGGVVERAQPHGPVQQFRRVMAGQLGGADLAVQRGAGLRPGLPAAVSSAEFAAHYGVVAVRDDPADEVGPDRA